MSARAAWEETYSKEPEFIGMGYNFFRDKLAYLRTKWKKKKGFGVISDWDKSPAKMLLDMDFNTEKLPADEKALPTKEAWKLYENHIAWEGASYAFFAEKLRALRRKWERRDAIDWRKSSARLVILYDLESGRLSIDDDEEPADELWNVVYKHIEEFEDVPFWQFDEKLQDHREQHEKSLNASLEEDMILAHDLALHQTTTHNHRGELKFYLTKAKELLRSDVMNGNHESLTPAEFQQTRREYHPFDGRKFRERIRQEIRFQKWCNYLDDKRKEKLAEALKEEKKKREKKNK